MKHFYKPKGICAQGIEFEVRDGRVYDVTFAGGCRGNLQAIGKLVDGMLVEDVIAKVRGIDCRGGTSCTDQLADALEEMAK